jgi:hypothetical protein
MIEEPIFSMGFFIPYLSNKYTFNYWQTKKLLYNSNIILNIEKSHRNGTSIALKLVYPYLYINDCYII